MSSPSAVILPGSQRAFTLLELLVVIAIIAVLTNLTIGGGRRAIESGRSARAKTELALLAAALETYQRIYGDYPQTDDPARLLQSLIGKRDPLNHLTGARCLLDLTRFTIGESRDPQVDSSAALLDPWGRPYVYVYKVPASGWTNPGFVLYSAGPDARDFSTLLPGGLIDQTPPENADNHYAGRY